MSFDGDTYTGRSEARGRPSRLYDSDDDDSSLAPVVISVSPGRPSRTLGTRSPGLGPRPNPSRGLYGATRTSDLFSRRRSRTPPTIPYTSNTTRRRAPLGRRYGDSPSPPPRSPVRTYTNPRDINVDDFVTYVPAQRPRSRSPLFSRRTPTPPPRRRTPTPPPRRRTPSPDYGATRTSRTSRLLDDTPDYFRRTARSPIPVRTRSPVDIGSSTFRPRRSLLDDDLPYRPSSSRFQTSTSTSTYPTSSTSRPIAPSSDSDGDGRESLASLRAQLDRLTRGRR